MTFLEFLSATIGQLVWPVLIVVLLIVLKEPLKKIVSSPRLAKFKAGPSGVELEFNEELGDVERELQKSEQNKAIESRATGKAVESDFMVEMKRLAEVSPRSVVMETHVRMEKLLRGAVANRTGEQKPPRYMSMHSLARAAVNQGLLSEPEASALDELTYLRNRVAHEPDEVITSEAALRYAEIATQVAIAIRLAMGQTSIDGQPPL